MDLPWAADSTTEERLIEQTPHAEQSVLSFFYPDCVDAIGETLRISVLTQIPEEPSLLAHWNALALQMERPQVVYSCEWALAVQAAYGGTLQPLVFLGYDGDELAGVVCLATDPSRQNVTFLTATTGDYCEFLSAAQRRVEFIDSVFAELRKLKFGALVLANLPADSATPGALREAAKKHSFYLHIRPAYFCPEVWAKREKRPAT